MASMMGEGKWIEFWLCEKKNKTSVYNVTAKEHGEVLGQIKWFGRWRTYSFFPANDTVFERTCLHDVINFIDGLMQDRKNKVDG